jgi:hypothetical protein
MIEIFFTNMDRCRVFSVGKQGFVVEFSGFGSEKYPHLQSGF